MGFGRLASASGAAAGWGVSAYLSPADVARELGQDTTESLANAVKRAGS